MPLSLRPLVLGTFKHWMQPLAGVLCLSYLLQAEENSRPDVGQITRGLMEAQEELDSVPFREVMLAASGHKVLPCDPKDTVTEEIIKAINLAAKATAKRLNAPDSPARASRRINEVSRLAEDWLREELNRDPALACEIPETAKGTKQRSGYPDLRVTHRASGRVAYLDPKLYETSQGESSLRSFYFQPRRETNKVRSDAHHLLLGFEHDGKVGQWRFSRWKLIDLHGLRLQLKAEFHASNREAYRKDGQLSEGLAE